MSFNQHLGKTNSPLNKYSDRERVRDFVLAKLKAIENSLKHKHYDAARMEVKTTMHHLRRM